MELIADTAGVIVYDDYGHHPTEVRATLAAMRQKVGDRRLWAVFEPHMYSRTALFMDEFAHAFTDADEVVIADIFASRDTDEALRATSAEALADAIERTSAVSTMAGGDVDTVTTYVAEHLRPGDAVLVMGAGKSYQIAPDWLLGGGGGRGGVLWAFLGGVLFLGGGGGPGARGALGALWGKGHPPPLPLPLLFGFRGVLAAVVPQFPLPAGPRRRRGSGWARPRPLGPAQTRRRARPLRRGRPPRPGPPGAPPPPPRPPGWGPRGAGELPRALSPYIPITHICGSIPGAGATRLAR